MAVTDFGSGGGGAYCALHPELGATGTCARCGNFMCEACSERGAQPLCPACRQRAGNLAFPLRRDTWSFSALWDHCLAAFKREWLMLSVAALVSMGVSMMANLAGNVAGAVMQSVDSVALIILLVLLSIFVQVVVQGVMGLGMLRVVFDVLEGRGADIGRLFSQWHKAGRYLVTVLLAALLVLLPLMLFLAGVLFAGLMAAGLSLGEIVSGEVFRSGGMVFPFVFVAAIFITLIPALYFGLPLYLLQAELTLQDDVTPMQAVRNCYVLARGERLSMLGVSVVAGLVALAGFLACCVGLLPAIGLAQLLLGGLYLALRNGSELDR